MRKKYKLSFLIIISLSFSGMMISVLGQTTYTCKAKAGDQVILELLEADEYYLYHLYQIEECELGAKRKFQVSNVTEVADSFLVDVKVWNVIAANETFNNNPDITHTCNLTKDPAKLPFFSPAAIYPTPVVLYPVNSYLSEYVLGSPKTYFNITSDGNTLESRYWPGTIRFYWWPYTFYTTFDSKGFISEMKTTNSTVLLERWGRKGQSSTIPGYDLSIVIGLTTIAGLSLVYIWKKKRLI